MILKWFLISLSLPFVKANNVAMTSTGIAIAATGNGGLIVQPSASGQPVVQPLPTGIQSFDDVSIDAQNEALVFALSVVAQEVCSFSLLGVALTPVNCVGGNFGVAPFSGVSALDSTLVISGGTLGVTVYDYNGQSGSIANSPAVLNLNLGVIGNPDVVLLDSDTVAFSSDLGSGTPRFGSLLATIDKNAGTVTQFRSFRIFNSLEFNLFVKPANFPLVNAIYETNTNTYMYTANGPMNAQEPLVSDAIQVLSGAPNGFNAVTVAVNTAREILVFGGVDSSGGNGQILFYDLSVTPENPTFMSSVSVMGRITSVASGGNTVAITSQGNPAIAFEQLPTAPSLSPTTSPVSSPTGMVSPTAAPTNSPTALPTAASSVPPQPLCTTSASCTGVLTFFGFKPNCLLPLCAGHCEIDSDCDAGLFCFQRDPNSMDDSVPGCETVAHPTTNYCVAEDLNPSSMPTSSPSRVPTAALTNTPSERPSTLSGIGVCGVNTPVQANECPSDPDIANCLQVSYGSLCEADGECPDTFNNNNCGAFDIYRKADFASASPSSTPAPSTSAGVGFCGILTAISPNECPMNPNLNNCLDTAYGNLCAGKGECGTTDINNCGDGVGFDIYRKTDSLSATPSTTSAPSSPRGLNECGLVTPITGSECPANPNIPNCLNVNFGMLCEGDGECGTDPNLNNCGGFDVYRKTDLPTNAPTVTSPPTISQTDGPTTSPTSNAGVGICGINTPIDPSACPANPNIPNCLDKRYGNLCEGDGECGTDPGLNNCGGFDVYLKTDKTTISPVPTQPPVTSTPTFAPTRAPTRVTSAPTVSTTSSGGIGVCGTLTPIDTSACPGQPNIANCDVVRFGNLCEADGECGTDSNLDNCGAFDIYLKTEPTPAPTLAPTISSAPVAPQPPTATGAPIASSNRFDITLMNMGTNTDFDDAFIFARERWEEIIVGDLQDFGPGLVDDWFGGAFGDAGSFNGAVDDVVIGYALGPIDGPGAVLGSAGARFIRPGTATPLSGVMNFDEADFANLPDADAKIIILHEMGHVLGLVGQNGSGCGCDSTAVDQFAYPCPLAQAEYEKIFPGQILSLENNGGGGTMCAHWEEDDFPASTGSSELMTGFFESFLMQPITRVTIGALDDIPAYTVNYNAADPHVFGTSSIASGSNGSMGNVLMSTTTFSINSTNMLPVVSEMLQVP